jgi:hypothetical protein
LLKTRIAVHSTNPNPFVTIENRDTHIPFTSSANVTAPYLNESSLNTFISNGAAVEDVPINRVDELPDAVIEASDQKSPSVAINAPTTITFTKQVPANVSALQILELPALFHKP